MNDLQKWIACVFDHPVTDPAWYWAEDAPEWQAAPEDIPALIAETFEQGGELLAPFSDAQLDQGFWFLAGDTPPHFMLSLVNPKVALATRLRALRSFVPLFQQVMATRCSPDLGHLDEPSATPLNSACYIWWDLLWYQLKVLDRSQEPDRALFDAEVLVTLRRLLAIPHDACRESALHGIGHWVQDYPQAADIADEFLFSARGLRPELIAYAQRAKAGNVL